MRIINYFIFYIIIFFLLCGCKSINNKNQVNNLNYENALKLWESKKIESYYIKIKYAAFSPTSGIWELTFKDGKLEKWIKDNSINNDEYKEIAEALSVEKLFELSENGDKRKSIYIKTVKFNNVYGYPELIDLKIKEKVMENAPYDSTYKYEILDFKEL